MGLFDSVCYNINMKKLDLYNKKFNNLIALFPVEERMDGKIQWLCRCDCGNEAVVMGKHLKNGNTKSCGCLRKRTTAKLKYSHGKCSTSEYIIWQGMKQRCSNPNQTGYRYYGGRGISVCERWLNSFEDFLEDMGLKPNGYSIDRIDNDGNYEPSNCRWATSREQNLNKRKRKNTTSEYKRVYFKQENNKWGAWKSIDGKTKHLGYFKTEKNAAIAAGSI